MNQRVPEETIVGFVRRPESYRAELFDKVGDRPFREEFKQWAKARRLGLNVPANFGKYNTGQPVAREFVIEMSQFLKSLGRACSSGELMEDCDRPDVRGRIPDFFSPVSGFADFLSHLLKGFNLDKSSFIQGIDLEEFEGVGEIMLHCVGKHADPRLTREAAIASGSEAMCRSPPMLAETLRHCHRKNRKSVLLARCKVGGTLRTVAIGWLFAVTDDFFERMASGETEDLYLTPDDILPTGRNLFAAIVDNLELDNHRTSTAKALRHLAMIKTMCYQFAAMTRGIGRRAYEHVRWITLLPTIPQNEPQATAHGFRDTGKYGPATGFPIVILERPTKAMRGAVYKTPADYRKAVIEYEAMLFVGRIFARLSDARRP